MWETAVVAYRGARTSSKCMSPVTHQGAVAASLQLSFASLPQVQAAERWPQLQLEEQGAAAVAAGWHGLAGSWRLGLPWLYAFWLAM